MAPALRKDQVSNPYVYTYNFHSDMSSLANRQIRFQVDRIGETISIAIYRLPENTLINTLDSSRVTVTQKATGDLRRPLFKPTTLNQMKLESVQALLGSLKTCKIYPINLSPDSTVTSFTINY